MPDWLKGLIVFGLILLGVVAVLGVEPSTLGGTVGDGIAAVLSFFGGLIGSAFDDVGPAVG